MDIYVVTMEGVYRHGILGVYASLEAAKARALEVAEREDGYHEVAVGRCELNTPCPRDRFTEEDDVVLVGRYTQHEFGPRDGVPLDPLRWVEEKEER